MARVYYWRDVIGNRNLFEPYQDEIERLLLGEYVSLSLERLNSAVKPPIYSIRTNRDTRILFTTYQGKVCLLDVVEHHDYQKSRFLRNKGVLKAFLSRFAEEAEELEAEVSFVGATEIDELEGESDASEEMTALDYYQRRLIQLNVSQQEALKTPLPAMVYGPAGSGKSCVAFTMLMNYVGEHREDEDAFPVAYVTQSRPLLEEMKRLWQEAGGLDEAVCFKTYSELQAEQLGIDPSTVNDTLFHEWFDGWYTKYKKRHRVSAAGAAMPLQTLSAEIVWREFRIHSGYDRRAYMSLGERQSGLDGAARELVCEAYELYLAHLSEKNQISPVLSTLSAGHYRLVVVDEAQDLSYGQLRGLQQLSDGNIVYFLGDHQVLFDGKSRWFYLHELFRSEDQNISEIALQTTYRSCQRVIDMANTLIQLKYQVTGGHADGVESSELILAPDVAGVIGETLWISPRSSEIAMLQTEVSSAKFAVVTWPEYLEQAREIFNTPLIFTPKEIKGLEYDIVVIWRPLDTEEAKQASEKLLHVKPGVRLHRAKAGAADDSLLPYFNELITAVTRARFRAVVVQEHRHAIGALADALHAAIQPSVMIDAETSCLGGASGEAINVIDWEQEAMRHVMNDNVLRAREIFIKTLRRTEANFQAFLDAHQMKSMAHAEAQSAGIPVVGPVEKVIVSEVRPSHVKKKKKKRSQHVEVEKKQEVSSVPLVEIAGVKLALQLMAQSTYGLTQEMIKAFCCDGSDGVEKTLLYHLAMRSKGVEILCYLLMSNPALVNKIPLNVWGKTVESGGLINTSPLYWLTRYDSGCFLLQYLAESAPLIIRSIPAEAWSLVRPKKASDADTTPLYWLSRTDFGQDTLYKIIASYPRFIELMPASVWGLARPMGIGIEAYATPLYWLSTSIRGRQIIRLLIERHSQIINLIAKEAWSLVRSTEVGCDAYTTPLYWLASSDDGRLIFRLLIERHSQIIQSFPDGVLGLVRSEVADMGDMLTTPVYWLTTSNEGCDVLQLLIERHPQTILSIPAEVWGLARPHEAGKDANLTPLFFLTSSARGCHILQLLMDCYPQIIKEIPTDAWGLAHLMEVGKDFYTTPLYWLSSTGIGRQFFYKLIKTYPHVAGQISVEAWSLKCQVEVGKNDGFTPIYWLSATDDGRQILRALIEKCPKMIRAISTKTWGSMIQESNILFKGTSPLFNLATTAEGCCIFRQLIECCPDIIVETPVDVWMSMVACGEDNDVSLVSLLTSDKHGKEIIMQLLKHHTRIQSIDSVRLLHTVLRFLTIDESNFAITMGLTTRGIFRVPNTSVNVEEAEVVYPHL